MLKRFLNAFVPMEGSHYYLTSSIAYVRRTGKIEYKKHQFRKNTQTGVIEVLTIKKKWIKLNQVFSGGTHKRILAKLETRFTEEYPESDDSEPPKSALNKSDSPYICGIVRNNGFLGLHCVR
jgi:hypothetical protein